MVDYFTDVDIASYFENSSIIFVDPDPLIPINASTFDTHERILVLNWFGSMTMAMAVLSTIALMLDIGISLAVKDYKKPSARMALFVGFACLLFSVSWVVIALGHIPKYAYLLVQNHNTAYCAAFGLNNAGGFGLVAANTIVLWSATYTLKNHQIITWKAERMVFTAGAFVVLISGAGTGVFCSVLCSDCKWNDCQPSCKDLIVWAIFGWVISLAAPLSVAIAFLVVGCRIRSTRHLRDDMQVNDVTSAAAMRVRSVSKIPYAWSTREVNVWVRNNRFGRELFDNLWRDIRHFPALLIFFAVVYTAAAVAFIRLFPAHKYYASVDPTSTLALIIEVSWLLTATLGFLVVLLRPGLLSRVRLATNKLCYGYQYPDEVVGLSDDDELIAPSSSRDYSEFKNQNSDSDDESLYYYSNSPIPTPASLATTPKSISP